MVTRRFLGLTLLPGPERRCQQPGVPRPRCLCGSLCSRCAGQRSSGRQQEGEKGRRMCKECESVPGGELYLGCTCCDQEAQLIRFPTSSSKPQTDVCHLLIFQFTLLYMQLLCNSGIRMPFWGRKDSHYEYFLL